MPRTVTLRISQSLAVQDVTPHNRQAASGCKHLAVEITCNHSSNAQVATRDGFSLVPKPVFLNGLERRYGHLCFMWHISTSGLIFNAKFKIGMVELLFEYEVWRRLRQVLCVLGAKQPIFDRDPKRNFFPRKHAFRYIE